MESTSSTENSLALIYSTDPKEYVMHPLIKKGNMYSQDRDENENELGRVFDTLIRSLTEEGVESKEDGNYITIPAKFFVDTRKDEIILLTKNKYYITFRKNGLYSIDFSLGEYVRGTE